MNKILFIISDFEGGGTQKVISLLANYLVKKEFKIKICIINQSKTMYKLSEKIEKINLGVKKNNTKLCFIFKNLKRLFLLRQTLKIHREYILLSFLTTTNILCLLSSVGLNFNIIINERNDVLKQKLKFSWKILKFLTYKFADKMTTNNKSNFKFLKKKYGAIVIYLSNPIKVKKFTKIKKEKIILSVGRLHYQKNYFQILRCFKVFTLKNNNWVYYILGEGELKKRIQQYINFLDLKEKVKIFNFTNPSPFYKKASILVHGAKYEGTPNVLLEAMSYGLPIISSNYIGSSDIIKNNYNGIIYQTESDKDLVEKMTNLSSSLNLRKKLSKNGLTFAKKFDVSIVSKEWINLFKQLKK